MGKKKKEEKRLANISFSQGLLTKKRYYISVILFFFISYFTLKEYLLKFPFDLSIFLELINPLNYFSINVLSNISYIFLELLKLLLFFLSTIGYGRLFLKILKIDDTKNNLFLLSYLMGLGVISIFTLITGIFSLINKNLYLVFLFSGVSLWIYNYYKSGFQCEFSIKNEFKSNIFYSIIFIIIASVNLLQSLSPEIFYDTLVYHLGVPNYWLINRSISDLPYNIYSKLALNHSLIYLFSLTSFGGNLAQLVNFLTSIFSFFSIVYFFQKYFQKNTTFLAAIVFYSIFHVAQSSQSAASDIIAFIFTVASFYTMLRSLEANNKSFMFLFGLFSGFAFGTKYNTAFIIISELLIYVYVSVKEKQMSYRKIFSSLFIFSSGFLIFTSFWFIKNTIYYSNPIYPFAYKLFNKNISPLVAAKIDNLMAEISQSHKFNLLTWLKLPFLISTGQIINSEFFTPIFLMILPLGIFIKETNKIVKYLITLFLFSYLMWSLSSTTIRHLFSAYFSISLVVAYYINEVYYGWFKRVLNFSLFLTILFSINWIFYLVKTEERYKVVMGDVKKDDYLSISHPRYPNPSYNLINYINENLDEKSKVLFVAEPKSYYMTKKFEASSVFDTNPLIDIVMDSSNSTDIYKKLRDMGFTHILINIAEVIRINKDYNLFYWKENDLLKFNDFFEKHLQVEKEYERIINNKIAEKSILYKIVDKKDKKDQGINYIKLLFSNSISNKNGF